jgi:hypothetical protein
MSSRCASDLRIVLSIVSILACLTTTAPAQLIVNESFDYSPPGSDLLGQEGGTGFSGPWFASGFNASIHDNYDVAPGSLSFQGLPGASNSVETAATEAIAGIGRNLAAPIAAGDSLTVYFSFLARPEGVLGQGIFNGFLGVYLDGTDDADLFIGKPGSAPVGQYVLENRGGSNQVQSGIAPVSGTTALLVVRADMQPGPDVFTLYVNPEPCEPEPAFGTVKSDLDLGDLTAVVLYSSGAFSIDEMRMGSTFAQVVAGGAICPASEPFEYAPAGADLLGQLGGSGFDGAWFESGFNASLHDNYDIASGSLSFKEMVVTGERATTGATEAIAGLGRNLAAPISAGITTTVYLSLLVRPEGVLGNGVFNGFFGLYLDGTDDADLFVGKPGSDAVGQYVMENRGGAAVVGETALLVVRASLQPGTDIFTLYVNPDPCQPEPEPALVKADLDLGDVTAVVIYSTGAFSLDEVRIGPSFEAVVRLGDPVCPPTRDCNENGVEDSIDISSGVSLDVNLNGIPDECETPPGGAQIPSDCNQDGHLDLSDGVCLLNFLFRGTVSRLPCDSGAATDPGNVALLDSNGDAHVDLSDALRVFGFLFQGRPPPVLGTTCTKMVGCPDGPACGL